MSRLALAAALAVLALSAAPGDALARSEKVIDYQAAKVWPTAVRFLRVDEGVTITDKDADAGYVLFELTDDGKTYNGALELVAVDDEQGPRVRIAIRIEDRPDWMEVAMLDRLQRKIKADLGSPPPRKRIEKAKPEPPKKTDPTQPAEPPASDKPAPGDKPKP